MKIKTEKLKEALELVKPGLASKEILEQSTKVAFKDGELLTYNDETAVRYALEGLDINAVVSAKELYKFVSKVKTETIDITGTPESIEIKAGHAKIWLNFDAELRLPIEEMVFTDEWHKWPAELTSSLQFIAPVCSDDVGAPKFQCVHIRTDGMLEASDRISLVQISVDDIDFDNSILLPKYAVAVISKYNVEEFQINNGWIHMQTKEQAIVSCRIIEEDTFPDVSSLIKDSGTPIELPDMLDEMLEKAIIFVDGVENFFVEITIADNQLHVFSSNSVGKFKEKEEVNYNEEPIKFVCKPEFFRDMYMKTDKIKFDSIGGEFVVRFIADNWQYMMMVNTPAE
jgi:hypothetical protein